MRKLFFITLFFVLVTNHLTASAAQNPRGLAADSRIKVVPYDPNNVVVIHGSVLTNTTIQFGQDETILSVQNGDQDAWSITPSKVLPYLLFIKPTMYNSNTDLMVATDKHIYQFQIISPQKPNNSIALTNPNSMSHQAKSQVNQKVQPDYTYAVRFSYPQDEQMVLAQKKQLQATLSSTSTDPTQWNWRYYTNNTVLAPVQMMDDSKSTYILFRPHQPIPAIFAVLDKAGHEALVNYHKSGNYIVIDRVARQFTFRNGHDVTCIFNKGYSL